MITKPWELEEAELIDGFCQRYSCLPSQQLMAEDATILRMVAVVQEGQPEGDG